MIQSACRYWRTRGARTALGCRSDRRAGHPRAHGRFPSDQRGDPRSRGAGRRRGEKARADRLSRQPRHEGAGSRQDRWHELGRLRRLPQLFIAQSAGSSAPERSAAALRLRSRAPSDRRRQPRRKCKAATARSQPGAGPSGRGGNRCRTCRTRSPASTRLPRRRHCRPANINCCSIWWRRKSGIADFSPAAPLMPCSRGPRKMACVSPSRMSLSSSAPSMMLTPGSSAQTPAAIARAYRNMILSRCQKAGLALTDDEHQLIDVWFGAAPWGGAPGQPSDASSSEPSRASASRPDIPLPPDFDEAQNGAPGRDFGGYGRSLKRHG